MGCLLPMPNCINRDSMKGFALNLLLMLCLSLSATTWEVKQDGSGHFTHIQDAIDVATHGDSIKVFPGTYVENIDYIGKNIFIYSLEYTTGNPAYRDSTIIDGNRSGSVVKSVTATTNCGIYGFTIQNGSGDPSYLVDGIWLTRGGGFYICYSQTFCISNSRIDKNIADSGGGIMVKYGTVAVSNTQVTENYARRGGGILLSNNGQMIFDQINRCSVYNNSAAMIQDIWGMGTGLDTNIYLDKATSYPHTNFYIYCNEPIPNYNGSFPIIDIQQGYRTETNHDFYVSTLGDDNNDGLSPTTPLRSVHKAMQLIASDEENPKTIHMASGVYSSSDGFFYPIGTKPYVSVIGDSVDVPILENLHYYNTIGGSKLGPTTFKNFILRSSSSPLVGPHISVGHVPYLRLENIVIEPHHAIGQTGIMLGSNNYYPFKCVMKNVHVSGLTSPYNPAVDLNLINTDMDIDNLTIEDCHSTGGEIESPFAMLYFHGAKFRMKNSKIVNTSMAYNEANTLSLGFWGEQADRELKLDNVLIANNQTAGAPPVFIAAFNDNPGIINNCTFANNSGANFAVQLNGNFEVNNCIFDNDTPAEIKSMGSTSQIDFNNNFIRNYPASTSFQAYNNVSFNEVVLSGEPGFCSSLVSDPFSYRLANNSVCRDMGTPDTLGLSLPEIDLAGNPRIYGAAIDLGCYEWNYPVGVTDMLSPQALELRSFPNPFSAKHTVLLNLKRNAYLNCDIYNLRGQKVRSLADSAVGSGEQMLVWDGRDDDGKLLGSGIYFLKLRLDGKVTAVRRLVLAK